MRIVVAGGKGGTGKTTVATSLAQVAAERDAVRFLDCDVETPNAALFLDPILDVHRDVGIRVPRVDPQACNACGTCAEICRFNAIAVVGGTTLVFDDLCHGCGSCTWMCPEQAITDSHRRRLGRGLGAAGDRADRGRHTRPAPRPADR
ncbi:MULTISPECIES: 4Fe-4S binding protein [unclassified Thiocapsa]|uniref:4Fe-4S binding protein n=1 Tax=unclassified Thiocapsa TaxID=2641286 RepID=UPI0035B406F4